jgi:hypothetical protein
MGKLYVRFWEGMLDRLRTTDTFYSTDQLTLVGERGSPSQGREWTLQLKFAEVN